MAANCFQLPTREDDGVLRIVNVSVLGTVVLLYLENKKYIYVSDVSPNFSMFYWMYLKGIIPNVDHILNLPYLPPRLRTSSLFFYILRESSFTINRHKTTLLPLGTFKFIGFIFLSYVHTCTEFAIWTAEMTMNSFEKHAIVELN